MMCVYEIFQKTEVIASMSLESNSRKIIHGAAGQVSRSLRFMASSYIGDFQGFPRVVWAMAGVTLLNTTGRTVSIFLVLYLSISLQLSNTWVGLVIGAYGVGAIIGALVGGRLSRRISPRRFMIACLLGNGVGYVSLYYLDDIYLFMAVLFASSCFESAFRPAAVAVMMDAAESSERTRRYALYKVAVGTGTTAGAAVGGLLSLIEFALIFWFDGLSCFLAAIYLGFCLWPESYDSSANRKEEKTSSLSPWRSPVFLVLACVALAYNMIFFQRFSTYSLYLTKQYGFNGVDIGVLFSLSTLLFTLSILFVTGRLKEVNHRFTAAFGLLVFCSSFVILPFGSITSFAYLSITAMTVGMIIFQPAFMELIYICGDGKHATEALGMYYSIMAICRVAAPVIGIWALEFIGDTALWMACGVLGVGGAVLLLLLPVRPSPA